MGSEIDFFASNVDIDGFLLALVFETRPEIKVRVSEISFAGLATSVWGRWLDPLRDDMWAEAHMEAEAGDSTIETIAPADGLGSYDVALLHGPYRERALAGLIRDGDPSFAYESEFVRASCRWDGGGLAFGFDRRLGCTASLGDLVAVKEDNARLISTVDAYLGLDHRARAADHIRAVGLLDILAKFGQLTAFDSSGYIDHRDEIALIGAMAADRQARAELRAALAAYNRGRS
jgi:hypothetical protein